MTRPSSLVGSRSPTAEYGAQNEAGGACGSFQASQVASGGWCLGIYDPSDAGCVQASFLPSSPASLRPLPQPLPIFKRLENQWQAHERKQVK